MKMSAICCVLIILFGLMGCEQTHIDPKESGSIQIAAHSPGNLINIKVGNKEMDELDDQLNELFKTMKLKSKLISKPKEKYIVGKYEYVTILIPLDVKKPEEHIIVEKTSNGNYYRFIGNKKKTAEIINSVKN
ncbi:MAG: hypothetical protein ACO1OT_05625 [Heyndrickxia sp.]